MKKTFLMVMAFSLFIIVQPGYVASPKVTLYHPEFSQFELATPQGARIYMDVYEETAISTPPSSKDVLLMTHYNKEHETRFYEEFPGKKLNTVGELLSADYSIKGFWSLQLLPTQGSNYVYIIETGDLRIAHFGNISQERLTDKQLKALGRIDMAFIQFCNNIQVMDITSKKAFTMMNQLKPGVVVPTHFDPYTAKYAMKIWKAYYTSDQTIALHSKDMKGSTKVLFFGEQGGKYGANQRLKSWPPKQ